MAAAGGGAEPGSSGTGSTSGNSGARPHSGSDRASQAGTPTTASLTSAFHGRYGIQGTLPGEYISF